MTTEKAVINVMMVNIVCFVNESNDTNVTNGK